MNKAQNTLVKYRKAQIGKTLTWFTAFVIIFFIMTGFVALTGLLTGKKFLSRERSSINLEEVEDSETLSSLDNQIIFITMSTLVRILNTFVEEKTIEDLIFEWQLSGDEEDEEIKEIIENKVKEILGDYENEDFEDSYFFTVNYGSGDSMKTLEVGYLVGSRDSIERKRISKITLFLNGQEINVELYMDKKEWGF